MTGPGHYYEAERLLREGGNVAAAQVHATLALAAATALGSGLSAGDKGAWRTAVAPLPDSKIPPAMGPSKPLGLISSPRFPSADKPPKSPE